MDPIHWVPEKRKIVFLLLLFDTFQIGEEIILLSDPPISAFLLRGPNGFARFSHSRAVTQSGRTAENAPTSASQRTEDVVLKS